MVTVASVNALDVDSIMMPIEPEKLEWMPSYLICELDNSPQLVKDVSGACCLARMGFRLYAYLTDQMKQDLCDYFCYQGLAVLPHTSTHCLVWGKIPCGLRILSRGLRHCRIAIVIIVKLPTAWRLHLLTCVSSQSSHHCVPYCQDLISVDIAMYHTFQYLEGGWCIRQYLPNAGTTKWCQWQCGTKLGAPTHSNLWIGMSLFCFFSHLFFFLAILFF